MRIDDKSLKDLVDESQDLHVDAMNGIKQTYPVLREIGEERKGQPVDTDEIAAFNAARRTVLARLGLGGGGLAARSLAYGSLGSLFYGLVATPASADKNLDIQILQTASSLEQLAVNTYNAALTMNLGGIGNVPGTAGQVVKLFAQTTMMQHDEHKKAFQNQTKLLGGREQTAPSPKFQPVVDKAVPGLKAPVDVVDFAATLEKVATDTYLLNLGMLEDTKSKEIMASVMGVEAQHLASLRAVSALLKANAPQLIKVPIGADLAKLPAAAGSVAFPDALESVNPPDLIADPPSGAVK